MSYHHHHDHRVTLDALATIFFAAATIWLVLAVMYSLSVLLFIRMRARGQLGSIYDANFGRVYLFGGNNDSMSDEERRRRSFLYRMYLPMGFLFRRFVMLSRTEEERQRQMNQVIRIMTPQERRSAMEVLLFSAKSSGGLGKGKSLDVSISKKKQELEVSEEIDTTLDLEQDSSIIVEHGSADDDVSAPPEPDQRSTSGGEKVDDEELGSNSCSSPNRATTPSELSCEYAAADDDCCCCSINEDDDERPTCSICLGEFDHDMDAAALEAGTALERHGIYVSKTCTHQFHSECILNWLERGNNTECPICRVPMVTDDEVWGTVKELRKQEQQRKSRQKKRTLRNFLLRWRNTIDNEDTADQPKTAEERQRAQRSSTADSGEDSAVLEHTTSSEPSETSITQADDEEEDDQVVLEHDIVASVLPPSQTNIALPPTQPPEQPRPQQHNRANSSGSGGRRFM